MQIKTKPQLLKIKISVPAGKSFFFDKCVYQIKLIKFIYLLREIEIWMASVNLLSSA